MKNFMPKWASKSLQNGVLIDKIVLHVFVMQAVSYLVLSNRKGLLYDFLQNTQFDEKCMKIIFFSEPQGVFTLFFLL